MLTRTSSREIASMTVRMACAVRPRRPITRGRSSGLTTTLRVVPRRPERSVTVTSSGLRTMDRTRNSSASVTMVLLLCVVREALDRGVRVGGLALGDLDGNLCVLVTGDLGGLVGNLNLGSSSGFSLGGSGSLSGGLLCLLGVALGGLLSLELL